MVKDVQDVLRRCPTCQVAKSHLLPQGLYTPLPVSSHPRVDVSMDFILSLPQTQQNKNSIFVVVNRFSKIFNDATCIAELCFKEVMRLHGIPRSIVSNQDTKFFSHFWSLYGRRWVPNSSIALLVTHRLTDRLKFLIEL